MTTNTDPVRALIGQWRDAAEFFKGDAGSDIRETLMACASELEAALAQQPAAGEEIMVNAAHDVFILPLQPSGLDGSGPRFVVHVPAPEQQPAAVDEAKETDLWRCTVCGQVSTVGRCCGEETREPFHPLR